ncbi:MAG: hypothetical protein CMJ83_18680, partial [Planctomycetes bacterium]|nr:hypothetical protein [Planctomycetota bacterium]
NREASYAAVDVDPAGVSQDVVLRLGPRGSKLNVILTTVEGEVLPRREFRVEVRQSDDEAVAARMVELDPIWKQQRSRRTRTNREGGISLDVRAAVGGEIVVFTSHGKGSKRPASTAPPEAVIPFPAIDEGATHDAGLITLPWYRVLAAGHVLYADGAPVHGIRVGVVLEAPPTPQSKKKRPRPPVIGLATTDSEGAFTLLGESPGPGALRIGARNGEGKVPSFPISLGVRDLRLQFMRYGGIRGRVRLADRTLPLRVDVIAEREDLPEPKRVSVNRDGRGEVHARNLISGVYRIRVYAGGLEALDLHGVQVPEGKTVTPGPIADLILGQGFRSGLVIVRDRLGAPAPKARVSTREREVEKRARPQSVSTDQDGEATIAWRSGVPLDVYVRAKGWSRRFRNPAFPLHVTVGLNDPNPVSAKGDYKPYAPPLIVIFDGALPRYAAIRRYDIALEPVGGAPRKPKPGELRLERTRIRSRPDRAEYIDVYPGTYDARLELSLAPRKPGGRSRRARVALGRVTVRGTPRERINLRVDSAAINYAVETTN